jgi:hypothetical protein
MTVFIRGRKIRDGEEGWKGRRKSGQRRTNETEMKNASPQSVRLQGNVHVRVHVHDDDCNTPRASPRGPYKTGEWLMVLMLRLIR